MLPPLLAALLAQAVAPSTPPVQSLVVVEKGALTLELVRALDLDLAALTRDGLVEIVADAADRKGLAEAGVPFTVKHEDLAAFYASRLTSGAARAGGSLGSWLAPAFGSGSMGGYYTFTEIVSVLDQIHAAYPALTTAKFSIGTSLQGRTLWAIKVSDNPDTDENEPEARFDALHHAREPESMQVTFWMMLALLERYGSDPLSTYLVDNRELWFVPCVNPDGYVYNQSTNPGGGGLWRKNRRANAGGSFGVDLNRNYAFEWGFDNLGSDPSPSSEVYRGTGPASEPEVAAMQAFIDSRDFKVAVSSHTYSDLWLWPWGYIAAAPANSAQYNEVGGLATEFNGYLAGPAGVVLYLANGVTDDYDHGMHGTLAFTPEIGGDSDGFWPPTNRIIPLAQENELAYLRSAWAAGAYVRETARATSEVGDGDGFVEPGESFRVVFTLRNSGALAASGLTVTLTSTTPGVSVTSGNVALGALASFTSVAHAGTPLELALGAGVAIGSQVDYVASVTHDGFTQEFPGSFRVGRPRTLLTDDLETNLGWTVGAPGDGATTGIWAYGNPVGTTNGSDASNPENDATTGTGVRCFATGNGSTTAGGDDVDGGPTTLISPRLDLSGVSAAVLTYQRWFANFTTQNDSFTVALSANDGASWTTVETVTGLGHNQWETHELAVEDHVALTDRVRVRFQTGDSPNDSITEAGVDELALVTFDEGAKLNFYGKGQIGTQLAVHVAANPAQSFNLRASTGTANIPLAFGTLLIQPAGSFVLLSGSTDASGFYRSAPTIPNDALLIGLTFHCQVLTVAPLGLSNRASITFQ